MQSRRTFLQSVTTATVAATAGLAGCTSQFGSSDGGAGGGNGGEGGGGDGTASPTPTPTATPAFVPGPSREVTDATGRTVTVPETAASVVAIGEEALRLLAYLEATDRVVGHTGPDPLPPRPYRFANPDLDARTRVGATGEPDAAAVRSASPDLVVDATADGETAAERQSAFRTPVVTVRAGGITGSGRETLRANLSRLGAALGGAAVDRAETVGAEFDAVVADLGDRAPGGGPSAYLGYVGRQREGLTRTLPSYPPFSLVGVGNVASGASGTPASDGGPVRADVTLDRIAEWDPEYLFVDRGTQRYDALSRSSLRSVRAIRDNHVYGLVPTSDYGPDVSVALANAYYVGSVCYPKAFDLDPKLTANSVYERLLGASVHDELVDAYGGGYGGVSAR